MVLIGLAIIASAICKTWILVLAFQESPIWGLACFVPLVMPFYVFSRWDETRLPILIFGFPSLVLFVLGLGAWAA